ncbi:putative signaling protein [Actinoplanes friuliensis DSM 7358]|uniref:Putative signaling protein n=1 Tax=Actinoplanes friuliensis DSM 7358 TaxID=1246995 RepID=U5W180_9ACTN|nr:putative signaling protein [Actinoplanes friuliensis DSM 7358]
MHPRAALAAGGALLVVSFLWLGIGLGHVWAYPVLGWLPLPVLSLLAARACRQTGRRVELGIATRRFWTQLGHATTIMAVGIVSNAYDAVGGPEPSQRLSTLTLSVYLLALAVLLWALLRLPTWQRSRSDWARFGLDTCIVLITSGVFVWHFSLRKVEVWTEQTGSAMPLLALSVVGFISVVTFVKVAFAGAGCLDRQSVRLLSYGTAASALFGGLSPFLVDRPYLSSSFVAVSVAAFAVQLAAVRQLHSEVQIAPVRTKPHRASVVPYLAVAATDALLLSIGTSHPAEITVMQISAVSLTALVIVRQIVTMRENVRLLNTVDANLGQLRRYQDQLEHQATHDTLTGIPNRALLEREIAALLVTGDDFHLALLDVDDFKSINDRLGHGRGDQMLVEFSGRLQREIRREDTVARLGGDEFVVLVRDGDEAALPTLLTRLLETVERPVPLDGQDIVVQASIGVTRSRPGDDPHELLRRADVAMYSAKAAGGNRWTRFDEVMDREADREARLGRDLRGAVARGELFLLYQPLVELPHGRLAGVEALLRWQHPEHGLVPPDVFVPIAERNGAIVEVGRWVLEEACRQAAAWQHRYGERAPGKVSINVSARQLAEPGFVAEVAAVLSSTGADRRRLMIEVTETAVLGADTAMAAVRELRGLGLQVALDDFGTGNSSLSLLVDCPVDVLKVDKSFVDGVTGDGPQALVVQSLITVAQGMRVEAVAEGVETPEQAQRLYEAGYRLVQGFLYDRPLSADDVAQGIEAATNSWYAATPSGSA